MAISDHGTREAKRHEAIIAALVRETNAHPDHVRELYERELAQLDLNARVRGYLGVLAHRNVRSALLDGIGRPRQAQH